MLWILKKQKLEYFQTKRRDYKFFHFSYNLVISSVKKFMRNGANSNEIKSKLLFNNAEDKNANWGKEKKNAWRVYTSRNRAKAGFAWQVVFIAFLADFQLSRKRVYVSRTTGLVNYKRMKNNINVKLKFIFGLFCTERREVYIYIYMNFSNYQFDVY